MTVAVKLLMRGFSLRTIVLLPALGRYMVAW